MGLLDSIFGGGDTEVEGDGSDIREALAQKAVESSIDIMYSLCVNNGQATLIESVESDFADQVDSIADGDFDEVDSDHPEAVGAITAIGNAICDQAANICEAIKEISQFLDV